MTDEMRRMTWWDYWVGHCWMTGWQTIHGAFRIWGDLMTSHYDDYSLSVEDDPEEECRQWFWVSLGEDNVYDRDFLDYLIQLAEDTVSGKIEAVPWDGIEDLLDDLSQ